MFIWRRVVAPVSRRTSAWYHSRAFTSILEIATRGGSSLHFHRLVWRRFAAIVGHLLEDQFPHCSDLFLTCSGPLLSRLTVKFLSPQRTTPFCSYDLNKSRRDACFHFPCQYPLANAMTLCVLHDKKPDTNFWSCEPLLLVVVVLTRGPDVALSFSTTVLLRFPLSFPGCSLFNLCTVAFLSTKA